ncbi:MAG: hypothetical protein JWO70_5096 [Betaproteobacteria bacterium]|nr:hypothetical protein [Betaproteobacteria bacterium]
MKNWSLAASAAVLLLTAGCATQRAPSSETMGASPAASPDVSSSTSASPGTSANSGSGYVWPVHVGHPWTAGPAARGSGPVHVGNPWTATWNMPAPVVVQTAAPAPAPAPVAAPAPAPVIAPPPPPEPAPVPQRRAPRASRG